MKDLPNQSPTNQKLPQTRALGFAGLFLAALLSLQFAILLPAASIYADGETTSENTENPGGQGDNGDNTDPDNPDNPDNPDQPGDDGDDDNKGDGDDDKNNTPTTPTTPTRPSNPTNYLPNAMGGGANRPTPASNTTSTANSQTSNTSTSAKPQTTAQKPQTTAEKPADEADKTDNNEENPEDKKPQGEEVAALDSAVLPSKKSETSEAQPVNGGLIAILALGASLVIALPVAIVVGHKLLSAKKS